MSAVTITASLSTPYLDLTGPCTLASCLASTVTIAASLSTPFLDLTGPCTLASCLASTVTIMASLSIPYLDLPGPCTTAACIRCDHRGLPLNTIPGPARPPNFLSPKNNYCIFYIIFWVSLVLKHILNTFFLNFFKETNFCMG